MKILIDSASFDAIVKLYNYLPFDGVTTNPTILKQEKTEPLQHLKKIRDFLPETSQLHVQVISKAAEEMQKEAHFILKALGDDTYIKVPVSMEGYKAMSLLKKDGVKITATAIYNPMQAFMAAKAGAVYTAPYVNRLDNMGVDGVKLAQEIHKMFMLHNLDCNVLGASFKNTMQIQYLCTFGIGSVTAAPDVLEALIKHEATNTAIENFTNDFYELCGEGKTMLQMQ